MKKYIVIVALASIGITIYSMEPLENSQANDAIQISEFEVQRKRDSDLYACLQNDESYFILKTAKGPFKDLLGWAYYEVAQLLKAGANINAEIFGTTPLKLAAIKGCTPLCKYLIERGAHINQISNTTTALDCARELHGEGHPCYMLLAELSGTAQRNNLPNSSQATKALEPTNIINNNNILEPSPSKKKNPPYVIPINKEKEKIYKKIYGATRVNKPDNNGITPLMHTTSDGDLQGTNYLILNGAGINAQDEYGCTPLMAASQNGHDEICRYLIQQDANVNLQDKSGDTALIIAALFGHKSICKLLVDADANIALKAHNGLTALEAAKISNNQDVYDFLRESLDKKMSITPLMRAALNGDVYQCQNLIMNGANPNTQDTRGLTALMHVTDPQICQILLASGASVESKDHNNMTPLMWAAKRGLLKVCEIFVNRKATISEQDANGDTASVHAARSRHKTVCEYLTQIAHDQGENELFIFAGQGCLARCRLLLAYGMNNKEAVNAINRDGTPLLNHTAKRGHTNLCRLLLEYGAQINTVSRRGETAIMQAVRDHQIETCKLLLKSGANLHLKNEDQTSAYSVAMNSRNKDLRILIDEYEKNRLKLEVLQTINSFHSIQNFVYPEIINSSDQNGITPLMVAASKGVFERVRILLKAGALTHLRDINGLTARDHAQKADVDPDIIKLLDIYATQNLKNQVIRKIIEAEEATADRIFNTRLTETHMALLPMDLLEFDSRDPKDLEEDPL